MLKNDFIITKTEFNFLSEIHLDDKDLNTLLVKIIYTYYTQEIKIKIQKNTFLAPFRIQKGILYIKMHTIVYSKTLSRKLSKIR